MKTSRNEVNSIRLTVYFHELECIRPGVHKNYIDVTRAKLQHFETDRYRGAVVRSTKKVVLGEQPTKRYIGDERRYALSKEILEIDQDGVTIEEPLLIDVKAFHTYYLNIFGKLIPTGITKDFETYYQLCLRLPKIAKI